MLKYNDFLDSHKSWNNSSDLSEEIEFPHDSKIWGPGMWFNLHMEALSISDEIDISTITKMNNNYIKYLNRILTNLPCDTCRHHATEYIKQNSPEEYKDVIDENGKYIGLFMWTWIFHNTVNTRLKKPTIGFETAINIYEDNGICTSDCGN